MKLKINQLIGLSSCLTLSLGTAEPALGQLEEVMVTAQKREQSLQDVPISISVLTAEDLDQQYITETDVACAGGPVSQLSGRFCAFIHQLQYSRCCLLHL